jgi:DHA2 family methylenomycin A resistance protein-like MFS transporter
VTGGIESQSQQSTDWNGESDDATVQAILAKRRAGRTIAAVFCLMFLISLDVTIINVALPTIQRAMAVSTGMLSWALVGYTLPFAALMLPGGALSDKFGAVRVFTVGVVIFGMGSLTCATASNFPLLVLGRVAQGVGGAVCMPSALALLRSNVPPQQLGRAIALWVFSGSVAISAGPILSGALVQFWTWRSIFLINVGIVALVVYLIWPDMRTSLRTRLVKTSQVADVTGQSLYVLAFSSLIASMILLRNEAGGFRLTVPIILVALSATTLVALILWERHAIEPVIPASLITNGVFRSAVIVGGSISLVNFGLVYCLGLYYGGTEGATPLRAGILFLPMMVACGVSSSFVNQLRKVVGDRSTVTMGLGAQLVGSILIFLQPANVGWVSGSAALLGFGVGLALPPVTAGLLAAVDPKITGVASGAFSSIRQFASAAGVAALGLLVENSNDGIRVDLRLASVICAAALAIALATFLASSNLSSAR